MLTYEWHLRWRRTLVYKSWLWVNYRVNPKHRYHFLPTGMKPGYCDYNGRINCALAKTVIDFVEKEAYPGNSLEEISSIMEEEIKFLKKDDQTFLPSGYVQNYEKNNLELLEVYKWCKKNFSQLSYETDKFYHEMKGRYDMESAELYGKEVDEMMIRIVKLRNFMWT